VHHARRAVGVVHLQPLPEQRGDFPGQAQHVVEGLARAGLPRGLQHLLHVVVQEGDLRCEAHPARHAVLGQRAQQPQPAMRGRSARLQPAGELRVERGDRHVDGSQALPRHRRDQVEIALHPAGVGDERER